MTIERQLYEALLEASSIFDNYPVTCENVGTMQVVENALDRYRVEAADDPEVFI